MNTFIQRALTLRNRIGGFPWRNALYRLGHEVWEHTYNVHPKDDEFAQRIVVGNEVVSGRTTRGSVEATEHGLACTDSRSAMFLLAAAKWVNEGCRILTTDSKYWAAMAHTGISRDAAEELKVPWSAFMVEWPDGMCVAEDGYCYNAALFAQLNDIKWVKSDGELSRVASFVAINNQDALSGPSLLRVGPCSLTELLFADKLPEMLRDHLDEERSTGDCQIQEMTMRAAAGLLYSMQHTKNWKLSKFSNPVQRGSCRSGPPLHRQIHIGRPIVIDVISSVVERSSGRATSAPSVQTLVRGHIKRQAIGEGRRDRKVIWVEPYWRGPEDAPILARPYLVH